MKRCFACGKECDGPSPFHISCFKKVFGSQEMCARLDAAYQEVEEQIQNKKTVTGVQKKVSLSCEKEKSYRKTIRKEGFSLIVKFPSHSYPYMVEMENLTMNMAEFCGIPCVPHALYPLDGSYVYVTRRIDRVDGKRLAMEDFCQLSNRLTEDKYKGSYESFASLMDRYSSYPKADKVELLYRILFCFVTGNNDMHLKNFSLIQAENGAYRLSSAYDLLNVSLLNPKDKEETALTIHGKKKGLRPKDFLALAEAYSIKPSVYEKLAKKLLSFSEGWKELIQESLLSEPLKEGFLQMIDAREGRIL